MLPTDKQARKDCPIASGALDYFPLAIAEVARLSKAANEQHNPGEPMHWAREKSTDHADCLVRHLIERGCVDEDGMLHSAKVAWRALALLQLELEDRAERVRDIPHRILKRAKSADMFTGYCARCGNSYPECHCVPKA